LIVEERTWLGRDRWAETASRGTGQLLTPLLQALVIAGLPPGTINCRWRPSADGARLEVGGLIPLDRCEGLLADLDVMLNQPVDGLRVCRFPSGPQPLLEKTEFGRADTCRFGSNQRWQIFLKKATSEAPGKFVIGPDQRLVPSRFASKFADLVEVVLNQVVVVDDDAFAGCVQLRLVVAGSGLRAVGDGAFRDCGSLTEFRGGVGVVELGARCFANDHDLVRVQVGAHYRQLREGAFQGCSSLREFRPCGDVVTVGDSVFHGCSGLVAMTFPESLVSLGVSVFEGCTALVTVDLASTKITTVDKRAFCGCTALERVLLPRQVERVGDWAFHGCVNLHWPPARGLHTIGQGAFSGCESLGVPDLIRVRYIGPQAFAQANVGHPRIHRGLEVGPDAFDHGVAVYEIEREQSDEDDVSDSPAECVPVREGGQSAICP
jgi:hypothetical protein